MNAGTRATRRGEFSHITSLRGVVEEYHKRFAHLNGAHHDPVMEFVRASRDLPEAIKRAVDNKTREGKTFSKLSCVRTMSQIEFAAALTANLHRLMEYRSDFDVLHDFVHSKAPWGIGDLSIYVVAERIACYLGTEPRRYLYLHAGPKKGWRRLTGRRDVPARVAVSTLPPPLRDLPVHQLEDLMCEFSDFLHPGLAEAAG
jgi:hypothetical protein